MGWHARSRLEALPILNPRVFSLRCTISYLLCISELSFQAMGSMMAIKVALDKLSDTELERHTRPEGFTFVSEAIAYMANKEAQSSEYIWRQQGHCLSLVARSRFARRMAVPGVAFEFVTRTGVSEWTAYRIPDSGDVIAPPAYFERNELMAYSPRPSKSLVCPKRKSSHDRLHRLGRAVNRIAVTLFA